MKINDRVKQCVSSCVLLPVLTKHRPPMNPLYGGGNLGRYHTLGLWQQCYRAMANPTDLYMGNYFTGCQWLLGTWRPMSFDRWQYDITYQGKYVNISTETMSKSQQQILLQIRAINQTLHRDSNIYIISLSNWIYASFFLFLPTL